MSSSVPAANVIIGTLYLFIIIAIGYLAKLSLVDSQSNSKSKSALKKFTKDNINKGLSSSVTSTHLSVFKVLAQSFAMKYSLVGSFFNTSKFYLLKEMLIISIVMVSCISINRITLWPLALSETFFALFFGVITTFSVPFIWQSDTKVNEESNPVQIQAESNQGIELQISLQPMINPQPQPPKKNRKSFKLSIRYSLSIGIVCFTTLVMFTQTMMTIYNSKSNLGALNLGSVASVIAIDQLLVRPSIVGLIALIVKIFFFIHNRDNTEENQVKSNLAIFENRLLYNLCEEFLLLEVNKIYEQHGDNSNYEMGASPTKKKTFSPSKVPKAQPEVSDLDTLTALELTKRLDVEHPHQIEEIQDLPDDEMDDTSPIKQINRKSMRESVYLTSAEKHMFGQKIQNENLVSNKYIEVQNVQKIKVNPNQYFSVQRLPKDELHHQDQIEDDGLILVQAGLNMIKDRDTKFKPNTMDIGFSPTKKRKKTVGYQPKRRQLIITGSSPYLEYLPDMMKKDKQGKKNLTPSSQYVNGNATISRKVL